VVTFNEKLTAIGGNDRYDQKGTRNVEIWDGGKWNDQIIPPVGNRGGRIFEFTALAIENQLFVFGNIS